MYELIQAAENSFYFQCPAKIGLVRTGADEVCLIDSGSDKDAGKKVRRLLDEKGWKLKAIYSTHSHADHIGGNRYLQTQTGCRIYAPGLERDFSLHPILEPTFLFGANPPGDLRHKFLVAQESDVLPLTEDVLPPGWQAIPLPGHSFDMVGYRTPDDIVFLADCLSSEATLAKYQISFLTDVGAYLKTLEEVKTMRARAFIPSHAEAAEDIAPLAQKNIDKVHEIAGRILDFCAEPTDFEHILKALFDAFSLTLTFEQYALTGSTVRAYLAWLRDAGKLQIILEDNLLRWFSAGDQAAVL